MPEFLKRLCSAFQSTLPYGSDLNAKSSLGFDNYISIHAPLRERRCAILYDISLFQFQSTLPCGSDLTDADIARLGEIISIHAPLRERRGHVFNISIRRTNFNPRSLAGATVDFILPSLIIVFQSTLPCGSDPSVKGREQVGEISIHAPLRERRSLTSPRIVAERFQSTLPCGSDALLLPSLMT